LALYVTTMVLLGALGKRSQHKGGHRTPGTSSLRHGQLTTALLLLAYIVDLALFQAVVATQAQPLTPELRSFLDTTRLYPPELPLRKEEIPQSPRARSVVHFFTTWPQALGNSATDTTVYAFAQHIPAGPGFYQPRKPKGLARLERVLEQRGLAGFFSQPGPRFLLMFDARVARSVDEAEQLLTETEHLDRTVVVRPVDGEPGSNLPTQSSLNPSYTISGIRAGVDRVVLEADISPPEPAWLVYLDSFHPGWQASVNGVATPVFEADLAFKAVPLPAGKSTVRLEFVPGADRFMTYFLALVAALGALGVLAAAAQLLTHGAAAQKTTE